MSPFDFQTEPKRHWKWWALHWCYRNFWDMVEMNMRVLK